MKKILPLLILVGFLAALAVVPAAAKSPVIKGEITSMGGENNIIVQTRRDQSVSITLPVEFDLSTIAVGDEVIAKGELQEDGSFLAEWVRKVGTDESEDEDAPEGSKAGNSAYCAGDKKDEPHPFASVLSEKYGVESEWVMGYYCDGYSMGAIMLALKTRDLIGADPDSVLLQRAGGMSWGAIWQELKLIGDEKDVQTPPGLLKKPEPGIQ
jgi:hypothetical protein